MAKRKIAAALPSLRSEIFRGSGQPEGSAHDSSSVRTGSTAGSSAAARRRAPETEPEPERAAAGGSKGKGAETGGGGHITVTLLSAADGLEDLAEATRRLASAAAAAASNLDNATAAAGASGADDETGDEIQNGGAIGADEKLISSNLAGELPCTLILFPLSPRRAVSCRGCMRDHRDRLLSWSCCNQSCAAFKGGATTGSDGPDLLLRFAAGGSVGSALTSDGFPPWYLRLTEIQYARTAHDTHAWSNPH